MTDMRLVVVGAAGRMGRMLVKTISETRGLHARRRDRARGLDRLGPGCRPPRRRRPGEPRDHRRPGCRLRPGRRRARFHRACRERRLCRARRAGRASCMSSAPPAWRKADFARLRRGGAPCPHRAVRQHVASASTCSPRSSAGRRDARRGVRHRDPRDASPHEGRRALRHGAAPRRGRRRGPGDRAEGAARCAPATAIPARAAPATSALRRCAAARWSASTRVIFAGPGERIELTHQAEDRGLFARGAIRAALWARDQKPGYYTMADVLGLVRPLSARPSFRDHGDTIWTASSSSSAMARANGTSRTCSPAGRTPA